MGKPSRCCDPERVTYSCAVVMLWPSVAQRWSSLAHLLEVPPEGEHDKHP